MYTYLVLNIGKADGAKNVIVSTLESVVPTDLPWISLYWVFAVVSLLMVVIIAAVRFPKVEREEDEKAGAIKLHLELLKNPTVIKYFLAIFAYVGTEQGIANWISKFLETYHNLDPQTTGASTISWYWGLMTAGALLGLVMLKFMDSRKVLIIFTAAAMVCLGISLVASTDIVLISFPMIGFFASVMWSVIISLGLNSIEKHHGSVSGILVTGIAGGAIVPLIVGGLGDMMGLKIGMLFLFIPLGYILSIGFWAKPLITNQVIGKRES
jgi:fucose permease